jgi:2-methylcitrate dehydratase PrpD
MSADALRATAELGSWTAALLARRVRVTVAPDLDARLPAERPARVTVRTAEAGEVA